MVDIKRHINVDIFAIKSQLLLLFLLLFLQVKKVTKRNTH